MFSVDGGAGAVVRGILPDQEDKVADFRKTIQAAAWTTCGRASSASCSVPTWPGLRVFVGDKVTLIAPQGTVTPAGVVPRLKSFRVVGIFEVGMFEYDNGAGPDPPGGCAAPLPDGRPVTGVRLKVDDLFQAPRIARELVKHRRRRLSATGRAATPIFPRRADREEHDVHHPCR